MSKYCHDDGIHICLVECDRCSAYYDDEEFENCLVTEKDQRNFIEEEIRADERKKVLDEEPRIKAFNKIYDICDDMIHEIEWYDVLARQKFDEIKRIVFDCEEQLKENKNV